MALKPAWTWYMASKQAGTGWMILKPVGGHQHSKLANLFADSETGWVDTNAVLASLACFKTGQPTCIRWWSKQLATLFRMDTILFPSSVQADREDIIHVARIILHVNNTAERANGQCIKFRTTYSSLKMCSQLQNWPDSFKVRWLQSWMASKLDGFKAGRLRS